MAQLVKVTMLKEGQALLMLSTSHQCPAYFTPQAADDGQSPSRGQLCERENCRMASHLSSWPCSAFATANPSSSMADLVAIIQAPAQEASPQMKVITPLTMARHAGSCGRVEAARPRRRYCACAHVHNSRSTGKAEEELRAMIMRWMSKLVIPMW